MHRSGIASLEGFLVVRRKRAGGVISLTSGKRTNGLQLAYSMLPVITTPTGASRVPEFLLKSTCYTSQSSPLVSCLFPTTSFSSSIMLTPKRLQNPLCSLYECQNSPAIVTTLSNYSASFHINSQPCPVYFFFML